MPKIDPDTYLGDEYDVTHGKRIERKNRRLSQREKQARLQSELLELGDKLPIDVTQSFTPSFLPAGHERGWLLSYLEGFYNDRIITDILGKVRGGKEATVYCCAAHPSTGLDLIAAKVYRPAMFRSLRNDAVYREGRGSVNEKGKPAHGRREGLAARKNTRYGQAMRHASWLDAEYETMQLLYNAGADIPKPLARGSSVILMEYIGAQNAAAPTLSQVRLGLSEARAAFDRLVRNLEIMLSCNRVHADLSAYNILEWEGQFKIIDFPQAVDPRQNLHAAALFDRDVERVCQYFARYKIRQDPRELAASLWARFQGAK